MISHEDLMRYLDGELAPERAREVEDAMERSTELRRDYVVFSRMKSDLRSLGEDMRTQETVWGGISRTLARPVGWVLFLVGIAVWLGYAVYAYLTSAEAVWMKLATSAVVVGLVMLFLSVVLDRLMDLKTDPYREIER